jgi:hypothetical protein
MGDKIIERIVFSAETWTAYIAVLARGELEEALLNALEDFVIRQREMLKLPEKLEDIGNV